MLGLLLLFFGGDYLVKGAVGLALKANIPPMLVGMTIVALGTSAPELLVSFGAAWVGNGDIAAGNVVGSNIANVGFILGITALIFPIILTKQTLKNEWLAVMIASFLLLIFFGDRYLSRWEGIVFIILLIVYLFAQFYLARKNNQMDANIPVETKHQSIWLLLVFIVGGCIALVFGAKWFLIGAVDLAKAFGISDRVIAVTLIAFGTSVPELSASLIAAFRKQNDISLGNILGSNLFNILFILGVSASISPFQVSPDLATRDMWWMIGISSLLLPFTLWRSKASKWEGFLMIALYTVYVFMLF